jgi:hypothetical protein
MRIVLGSKLMLRIRQQLKTGLLLLIGLVIIMATQLRSLPHDNGMSSLMTNKTNFSQPTVAVAQEARQGHTEVKTTSKPMRLVAPYRSVKVFFVDKGSNVIELKDH